MKPEPQESTVFLEKVIENLLLFIKEDPKREGLKDTPRRVAETFREIYSGYKQDPKKLITVFDSEGYDEMVILKDIEFYSTCEHHLVPFFGKASIAYIPDKKIIGISKLARILDVYARRLQNQERLTQQVANCIGELLKPKGIGIVIEAAHLCMRSRGVQKQNSTMITSCLRGAFKENHHTRNEFLKLIKK